MARKQRSTDRPELSRTLGSPWLTAGLALVVVLLAVSALVLPNLIGLPGPSHGPLGSSPTPTPSLTAGPTGPTPEPTFTRPTPSPEPSFTSHVVRSGDTLTSIATRFRTTARSIAWWNRGTYPSLDPESPGYRPNSIRPGWVLILMPGTTVDETDPPTPSPPLTGQVPGATPAATAQGGSIVLMHLGDWHTLEALPGILAAVQARGLRPVTLGEMFGA